MTAAAFAPAGFLSTEAAQGARRLKLAEIDHIYGDLRSTIDTEHRLAWDAAIQASCDRIKRITAGMTYGPEGFTHESTLRVWLARPKLLQEALEMDETLGRLSRVYLLALGEVDEARDAARNAFDFSVPLRVVEDRQCGTCGWMTSEHWTGGACPDPRRQVCGSCDCGHPMNCTCTEAPVETKAAS